MCLLRPLYEDDQNKHYDWWNDFSTYTMHGKILEREILTNNAQLAKILHTNTWNCKYMKLLKTSYQIAICFVSIWQMAKILRLRKFLTY